MTTLDTAVYTSDKPKPGNLTVENLENDQPDVSRFTAHYKPVSDKYGLGYNTRNPVDMATLHTLGGRHLLSPRPGPVASTAPAGSSTLVPGGAPPFSQP